LKLQTLITRFSLRRDLSLQELAAHEKLELHEYLAFKNVCAAKTAAMSKLAKDPGLKALLDDDLRVTGRQIQEVTELLSGTIH
jgi:similar to spore coat protein